jgi:serine/threonine protein kinase
MLDHPHVLKLFGAVIEDDNVCIVTELVPGGSLFDLIHTKPLLKSEAVIVIGAGVCKGMTYLHSMSVIHRDLKPGPAPPRPAAPRRAAAGRQRVTRRGARGQGTC